MRVSSLYFLLLFFLSVARTNLFGMLMFVFVGKLGGYGAS